MYVYWWHVGGLRAVKVGHADDPERHVSEYRGEHGLSGEELRSFWLERGIDGEWVESQLRRMLEAKGLRRIALRLDTGDEDFFALGRRTFDQVDEYLRDAARHIALAEVSNQRKQRRRQALQVPKAWPSSRQKQETNQAAAGFRARRHHAAAPAARAMRPALLIGAIVVSAAAIGLSGDDPLRGRTAGRPAAQKAQIAAARDGGEPPGREQHDPACTLVEISETLIHVNCARSSAVMRWNGNWELDTGDNDGDAVAFFKASAVAGRVAAPPSREPVLPLPLPEPPEVKPERPPQQSQPGVPAPSPAQPSVRPVPARSAPAKSPPQQEMPLARSQCTVSRPKPGFQVYLVTCPNSQVTIGRTVDSVNGWTIGDSVNGTEAIEFFMKSPYAR